MAQVDEPAFDQVQKKLNKPDSTIYKYIKPFEEAIGVDLRDIQYEDLVVANQVDGENNTRTILHGNLLIKDDLSIRT